MANQRKNVPKPPVSTKSKPVTNPSPGLPRTNTFRAGFWSQNLIPVLILAILPFMLYGIALRFGYILDDQMVIWQNTYVQKGLAGLGSIFGADSFMGYFNDTKMLFLLEGGRYRPLSLATFAAEVSLFGKDNPNLAGISHAVNILLYSVTGVFLYRILAGLFPLKEGGRWYFSIAFLASLLFIAHPLHVECIANIKGRDEILALLFCLLALYAALKYFDTRSWLWLPFSSVALFLGMLSKENALTFVAIIPLTVWFFNPTSKDTKSGISWQTVLWPSLVAAAFFILIRYKALGFMLDHGGPPSVDLMNTPFLEMTASQRLATISLTLGWYLKLLLIPYPLTHDYYPYHVPKVGWTDWRALVSLAIYLGMGIWAVLNIRRRHVAAYAIAFWFITLSIVSNLFVSVGTFMNERFAYMPSVAFCILVAWFFADQLPRLIKEQPERPYILGVMAFTPIVLLFIAGTLVRVPDWKDAMSLNISAINNSPNSARSHVFYVTSIFNGPYKEATDPNEKKKWVEDMDQHLTRSLEINPNYGSALIMKANVAIARFQIDHQLDRFFHELEYIMEKIPTNPEFRKFVDQNMSDYLSGSNAEKYVAFCHRIGYEFFFIKKKDNAAALHFLQFALDRNTEDTRIIEDMVEVYTAMGNTAKANEMKVRAEASRHIINYE